MLKMGLPAGAVKNALQRDGKDPSVIDLDPEKSLKSQKDSPVEEKDDGPPLCEDPQFTKVCGVGHMKSSIVQLFCSLTLFVANAILNTQYFKVRMSLSHEMSHARLLFVSLTNIYRVSDVEDGITVGCGEECVATRWQGSDSKFLSRTCLSKELCCVWQYPH